MCFHLKIVQRLWVRVAPSEVKEPVLTGYGDPPASLSQTRPIRVTMRREDFFYLWSGEASSSALLAALTGRLNVDNCSRTLRCKEVESRRRKERIDED
jgi:hypothetical protein